MKIIENVRYLLKTYDNKLSMSNFIWVAGLSERAWTKSRKSYSSHAEDLIIDSIISRHQFMTGEKINFSYLDIGAWRPIRGSNTYKFYKNGIRGTVVEPNPNLVNLWKSIRPKDQFIESACSQKKSLKLFEFGDLAASNSSNIKFVKFIMKIQKLSKPTAIKVKGMKLQEIIEKHIEKFPGKFLLDLDIEGEDEVTILNHKFTDSTRPLIILVEDHFQNGILKSKIAKYLDKNDFALVGRSVITSIFVDKKSQLKDSQIWI